MKLFDTSYLILLNENCERKDWGFENDGQVAIVYCSDNRLTWTWSNDMHLPFGLEGRWILVYSDHGLGSLSEESKYKKLLCQLVGNNVRIWDHGGGVKFDITMNKARKKFEEKGFIAAGFRGDVHLRPFSATTPFPWQNEMNNVRDKLFKQQELSCREALKQLDDAWNLAEAFFDLERPIQRLLEALFPLYVDLRNHQFAALEEPDFTAALRGAREELKFVLSSIELDTPRLKAVWNKVGDEERRPLAKAGVDLLTALDEVATDKAEDFLQKFKELSAAHGKNLGVVSEAESPGLTDPTST